MALSPLVSTLSVRPRTDKQVATVDGGQNRSQLLHIYTSDQQFTLPSCQIRQMHRKERWQAIIGKSRNCKLKGAPEPSYDIFVFRLDKEISSTDISKYLKDKEVSIRPVTQMSHKDAVYKSFKFTVLISHLNELLDEETWPEGVGVRRFRAPRESATQQT